MYLYMYTCARPTLHCALSIDPVPMSLQERFTVEVLQPFQSLQSTSEALRSSTALLSDRAAAEAVFEKFDCVGASVTG